MLTEDKVQADNMLDRMLVQAFLWYPEFDKEADICGGMVGVVVMFNVNHQESNTITPEKCIVPVHLLTRGFNARHQYEAKSGAQQARTVLVEQLYCPKECTSLLTCSQQEYNQVTHRPHPHRVAFFKTFPPYLPVLFSLPRQPDS